MEPSAPFRERLTDALLYIVDDLYATDFWGVCTQMAFYSLMAFFPMVIFLINFVGKIIVQFKEILYLFLKLSLPDLSYQYCVQLVDTLEGSLGESPTFLPILTFILASMAARAIMIGINQNYGTGESRRLPVVWFYAFVITFLFALSLVVAIVAYFILSDMCIALLTAMGLDTITSTFTQVFTSGFLMVILTLLFDLIYTLAPVKPLKLSQGLPGAIFCTLGIGIAFRIFVYFANHSTRYTMLYGNLGGLLALLVSIYLICVILNAGAKINVYAPQPIRCQTQGWCYSK